MYQIDDDFAPPVMSAVLRIQQGGLQSLAISVPRTYAEAHDIQYIFAAGYGGLVADRSTTGDIVTLTATSYLEQKYFLYSRLYPYTPDASTVTAWLQSLADTVEADINIMGDAAIMASAPHTDTITTGTALGVLSTIAKDYGLDFWHTAHDDGDEIIFKHISSASPVSSVLGNVLAFSRGDSRPQYQAAVITKTATITQRDTVATSPEKNITGIKYTSANRPYMEGVYTPVPALDGKTYSVDDLKKYALPITEQVGQFYYYFAFAPAWGHVAISDVDVHTESLPVDPPVSGQWSDYDSQYHTTGYKDLGIIPAGTHYLTTHFYESTLYDYRDQPDIFNENEYDVQNVTEKLEFETGHTTGSNIITEHTYLNPGKQQLLLHEQKSISTTKYLYEPQRALYPWHYMTRDISTTSTTTTKEETDIYKITTTTTTTNINFSQALFDGSFDFSYTPPSIDIETPAPTVEIPTSSSTRFDPTAAPGLDMYKYFGLGVVGNIRYSLGRGAERIALTPGHHMGILTARWINGTKIKYYEVRTDFDLSTIGIDSGVQATLISSDRSSFTTADDTTEDAPGVVSLTGGVWDTIATARRIVPYVLDQANRMAKSFSAVFPFAVISPDTAAGMIGNIYYILQKKCAFLEAEVNFSSEMTTFKGCLYE